jgi:hypothetical protein
MSQYICASATKKRTADLFNYEHHWGNAMRKPIGLPTVIGCVTVLFLHAAVAQEEAPAPTPVLEVFGCNFTEGNNMEDYLAVTARWNEWADSNGVDDYSGYILTPYLYSADLTYDFVWVGGWPNGAAMAAGEALWLAEGGDLLADFDATAECSLHAQFAEVVLRRPEGSPPEAPIFMFADCKVSDGRTADEALAATGQWNTYLQENGSDHFSAALFPIAGESEDAGYDYKEIQGFESIDGYGRVVDIVTAGGYERAEELFSRLVTCDSPRVYVGNRVRSAAPAE